MSTASEDKLPGGWSWLAIEMDYGVNGYGAGWRALTIETCGPSVRRKIAAARNTYLTPAAALAATAAAVRAEEYEIVKMVSPHCRCCVTVDLGGGGVA